MARKLKLKKTYSLAVYWITKDCLILQTQSKNADHEFQLKLRLQLTRLSNQIPIVRDKSLERILPEEGAGTFFHGTILNILGVVDMPLEERPSLVHQGFSVRKFSFVHNHLNVEKI